MARAPTCFVRSCPTRINDRWFAILGNHDHYGNAQAQIDFSKMAIDPRYSPLVELSILPRVQHTPRSYSLRTSHNVCTNYSCSQQPLAGAEQSSPACRGALGGGAPEGSGEGRASRLVGGSGRREIGGR